MKREIIFRAKRVDNGEWVEGYLTPFSGIDYKDKNRFVIHSGIIECHEVIPETVGQFTGMLDKNGKRIFEGDIVNHSYENFYGEIINEGNYEVFFDDECLEFGIKMSEALFYCQFNYEFEVIGNIYDNPELL